MGSVTFPTEFGGDGNTYTDDADPTTGLANGGHRVRFVPALAQAVAMANHAAQKAAAAHEDAQQTSDDRQATAADRESIRLDQEALAAQVVAASGSASDAANSATVATNMADSVAQATATYTSVSAALSATTDGDYFRVIAAPSAAQVEVYRNDSGSATLITTYYTKDGVDQANEQITRLNRSFSLKPYAGESLRADFTNQAYGLGDVTGVSRAVGANDMFTVERSTSKWVIGPQGTLVEVPPDTLAYHYDPVTGEALGALIEGEATNFIRHSGETWRPPWANHTAGYFNNQMTVPPVPLTGQTEVCGYGPNDGGTSFSTSVSYFDVSLGPGTYVVSALFKSLDPNSRLNEPTVRTLHRGVDGSTGSAGSLLGKLYDNGGTRGSDYDMGDGIFGLTEILECTPTQDGWYRYVERFEVVEAGILQLRFFPYEGGSAFTGDGQTGLYRTMVQLEKGTAPTSYIPTGGAQETRGADTVYRVCGDEQSTEFTVFIDFAATVQPEKVFAGYFSNETDDAGLRSFQVALDTELNNLGVTSRRPDNGVFAKQDAPFNVGERYKCAITISRTSPSVAVNGSSTIGSGDNTGLPQVIHIRDMIQGLPAPGMEVYDVRYFPYAMDAAELEALTS